MRRYADRSRQAASHDPARRRHRRLGSVLTARLAGQGLAVRVLTRDPSRAAHLAGSNVEVATGDVRDRASVVSAVSGAAVVVSAVHGFAGPVECRR